jgi:hypothetical protein
MGKKHTPYQATLLDPFNRHFETVPNDWPKPVLPFHRNITFSIATNTSGNLMAIWNPAFLSQANANTTFLYNNDNSYNLVTASATTTTAFDVNYNVPASNVGAYRVVSAGLRAYSQTSMLNKNGTIHFAMYPVNQSQTAVGGTGLANPTTLALTSIEEQPTYKVADITCNEAAQLIWLPFDVEDLEMLAPETCVSGVSSTHLQNCFIIIINAAYASSTIKFDLCINYELVPAVGSVLNGFEMNTPSVGSFPSRQVDEIWVNHANLISRTFTNHTSLVLPNNTISKGSNKFKFLGKNNGFAGNRPMEAIA